RRYRAGSGRATHDGGQVVDAAGGVDAVVAAVAVGVAVRLGVLEATVSVQVPIGLVEAERARAVVERRRAGGELGRIGTGCGRRDVHARCADEPAAGGIR